MSQHPRNRIGSSVVILLGVMTLFASRYWQVDASTETEFKLTEPRKTSGADQKKKPDGIVPAMTNPSQPQMDEQTDRQRAEHPFAKSSNPEVRELARLVVCAQSRECGFDQSTPISYDRELSALITSSIKRLDHERPSDEETRVARAFMSYPDDFVKSAALEILASAETTQENLNAVLAGLRDSASAPLYSEAMDTLEKYKGAPEVDKFVVETVQVGGHFASIELAKNSLRFMSPQNAAQFKNAVNQLPVGSQSREYLEANLREFQRLQEGG